MRIALLGGTFDPIHNGHLRAARAVADQFAIDEVHFIPAFRPPHKTADGITSAFHRSAMVAIAIAPFDRFRLSTIELDHLERRFTVDTLQEVHRRHPDAGLLFVVGTDLYAEIDQWKQFRRLFESTSLAVVNRPGFPMREDLAPVCAAETAGDIGPDGPHRVYYLRDVSVDISSTDVRTALANRTGGMDMVPPQVLEYIRNHELYS